MARILKIDNFTKTSPSFYGLEGDGSCYMVTKPFSLDILVSYNTKGKIGDVNYLEPTWASFDCSKGDLITCNKNGCYILPKENLKKEVKDLINSSPMDFAETKKITIISGI